MQPHEEEGAKEMTTKTMRASGYLLVVLAAAAAAVALAFATSLGLKPPPPVQAQTTTTTEEWRLVTDSASVPDASFKTVKGLSQGTNVVERDSGVPGTPLSLVDQEDVVQVVLSRPYALKIPGMDIAQWHENALSQPDPLAMSAGYIRRVVNGAVVNEWRADRIIPTDYRMVQDGPLAYTEELHLAVDNPVRKR
jgi:hypothetical protein